MCVHICMHAAAVVDPGTDRALCQLWDSSQRPWRLGGSRSTGPRGRDLAGAMPSGARLR
eukprot:SAG22_NODE_15698_length_343_cov_0.631148_1_plen_58_part_10